MIEHDLKVRSAINHRRFEAKRDVLYRLDHIQDAPHDVHTHDVARWADDGGKHLE